MVTLPASNSSHEKLFSEAIPVSQRKKGDLYFTFMELSTFLVATIAISILFPIVALVPQIIVITAFATRLATKLVLSYNPHLLSGLNFQSSAYRKHLIITALALMVLMAVPFAIAKIVALSVSVMIGGVLGFELHKKTEQTQGSVKQ